MFYVNSDYISNEKYDLGKFMPFELDNFDVLNSYFLENFIKLPQVGTFTISTEEYRPDLISYKIYENVYYWSLILMYNDIIDLEDLITGTSLKYFGVMDLENLFFNLRSFENKS